MRFVRECAKDLEHDMASYINKSAKGAGVYLTLAEVTG